MNDPNRVNMDVKQLHYTAWPDHGVPNGEAMDAFGQMIDISITHLLENDSNQKTVVHCSAGIGRTGTTITIIHAIINTWAQRNQGEAEPKLSIFSIARRIREQRYGLI